MNDDKKWFSRNNAFKYLEEDKENKIRIKKVINLLKEQERSKKILDLGCGDGQISKRIKDLGFEVYGFDFSKKNLRLAKKKGIKVKFGDLNKKIPYKKESFDIIFAGEIIEHIYDTKKLLAEIKRILKKEGILIITTPNLVHLPDRINFLKGQTPTQIKPLHKYLYLHIRQFTFNSLKEILKFYGFEIQKFQSTMVVFSRDKRNENIVKLKSELLAKVIPTYGCSLIVQAKKKNEL